MRHLKKGRKLKRTASHRKATLISLSTGLLRNKKIRTTLAKAKEARRLVERLITRAIRAISSDNKQLNVHEHRQVARYIKDRSVVKELFNEIAPKLKNRVGGYTRIVKLGRRQGDAAEVAILELVDYNVGKETPKRSTEDKKKGEVETTSS